MSHKDRNKSSVFWQSFTLFPFKTEIEEEVFAFTGNVLLLITGFLVLSLSLWGLVGVSCASPSIKHLTQPCSGRPHMACRPRGCTRASREGSGQGRGQTDDKAIGGGFALASAGCGAPERHLEPCPAWAGWTSASGHLTAHHPPQGTGLQFPACSAASAAALIGRRSSPRDGRRCRGGRAGPPSECRGPHGGGVGAARGSPAPAGDARGGAGPGVQHRGARAGTHRRGSSSGESARRAPGDRLCNESGAAPGVPAGAVPGGRWVSSRSGCLRWSRRRMPDLTGRGCSCQSWRCVLRVKLRGRKLWGAAGGEPGFPRYALCEFWKFPWVTVGSVRSPCSHCRCWGGCHGDLGFARDHIAKTVLSNLHGKDEWIITDNKFAARKLSMTVCQFRALTLLRSNLSCPKSKLGVVMFWIAMWAVPRNCFFSPSHEVNKGVVCCSVPASPTFTSDPSDTFGFLVPKCKRKSSVLRHSHLSEAGYDILTNPLVVYWFFFRLHGWLQQAHCNLKLPVLCHQNWMHSLPLTYLQKVKQICTLLCWTVTWLNDLQKLVEVLCLVFFFPLN